MNVTSLNENTVPEEGNSDSLEIYRQLYVQSPEALVLLDKDLIVREVNPAFTAIIGYQQKEVSGKALTDLTVRKISRNKIDWIKIKSGRKTGWHGHMICRKKSGGFLYCYVSISSVSASSESPVVYMAILRDVAQAPIPTRTPESGETKKPESQMNLVYGLAKLAECRDPETGNHLERIESYTAAITRKLGMQPRYQKMISRGFIQKVAASSPLHDIGKVGIPDSILRKPGPLTDEEFDIMKQHSMIGGDVLKSMDTQQISDECLIMGRLIAYEHHERYDGSGYPLKLSGDQISLPGRIVALADAYDCITSKRCYKIPESHEQAKEKIIADSGKHFDPDVVKAFLDAEEDILRIKSE